MLFTGEQVISVEIDSHCASTDKQLDRLGIAELNNEDKVHFINRTFAEFYFANFFMNQLNKGNTVSPQIQDCSFGDIFQNADYRVVIVFIDGFISRTFPSEKVFKRFIMHDLCEVVKCIKSGSERRIW